VKHDLHTAHRVEETFFVPHVGDDEPDTRTADAAGFYSRPVLRLSVTTTAEPVAWR
jgi:hypothetical protein